LKLIRHGENGFLAASADDWEESLGRLVADPALRNRLGMAGRQTVEAHFSMSRSATVLARVLRLASLPTESKK
jgi:glycosyltransferase involved in cell wall biosynthesis